MLIIGFLLLTAITALVEVPNLSKKKTIYPLTLYLTLLFIGSLLTVFYALNFNLPNPIDAINYVFKPISIRIITLFK